LRILLVGCGGQVGSALAQALAPLGELHAYDRQGLDLADARSIGCAMVASRPDIIVNAAAYTAVDSAEREPDAAFAVNRDATAELARQAKAVDALLIHFSTDYVYDGEKRTPYVESDAPAPLSVYGRSKLEGDRAIAASGCRHFIFRTSWVYGPSGRNFLRAILAAAQARPELRVVNDQHGAPTSSGAIAAAVAQVIASPGVAREPSGVYHLSAAGATTWHGFAAEILRARGLTTPLVAIRSDEYPVAARRPKYSVLDNARLGAAFGVALPDWHQGLAAVLREAESVK
jgi:dTDP-4-dehydrorhamnose reductase